MRRTLSFSKPNSCVEILNVDTPFYQIPLATPTKKPFATKPCRKTHLELNSYFNSCFVSNYFL